jgi:hypothetical protein
MPSTLLCYHVAQRLPVWQRYAMCRHSAAAACFSSMRMSRLCELPGGHHVSEDHVFHVYTTIPRVQRIPRVPVPTGGPRRGKKQQTL